MNKLIIIAIASLSVLGIAHTTKTVYADTADKVPIEVFERLDCQHCKNEKEFFLELKLERDDFSVRFHNVSEDNHYKHWQKITALENLPKVTPITLVGNTIIEGFDSKDTTGKRIEGLIDKSIGKSTLNFEEFIAAGGSGNIEAVTGGICDENESICEAKNEIEPMLITVPLAGVVDLNKYSLPALSILLGLVDGFNPCAMWVLVSFLVILSQSSSKKRMWQIAGLFIFAETTMYYLILNVWFTTWDFVGLDRIVTPIVGLVAVGGGIFFLYKWKSSEGGCEVVDTNKKKKTFNKIQNLINSKFTLITLISIIGIAFSVNIIEFACSIGIPQAFTKILELNHFNQWTKQFYMLLYILFYMFDDFIVFGIALYSIDKIGLTAKYSRAVNLIGGILMVMLGLILVLRPTLLIF